MRFTLILITLCFSVVSWAQTMEIGVLSHIAVNKLEVKIVSGTYKLVGDDFVAAELNPNDVVSLEINTKNRVRAAQNGQVIGNFSNVYLKGLSKNDILSITVISPKVKVREYHGDLKTSNINNRLRLINLVSMNNYLAGVVECEGGPGHTETYYMVQAIMSRTYALKYKEKHRGDGFQLCDQVHCQAYYHRQMKTPSINHAVILTDGMVMVDKKNRLIDAFFYANCGGQTCDASYVWNVSIPYLTPFRDTFCINTSQARWTTKIPKQKWVDFLVSNYDYPISDSAYREKIFHFVQHERKAFFHGSELGIPLRDIRHEFSLKSTFFSCYEHEEFVVLEGRGYGHGVGLCQEGAMAMARQGYHFTQILSFYFPQVIIRFLEKSDYFQHLEKQPEDF